IEHVEASPATTPAAPPAADVAPAQESPAITSNVEAIASATTTPVESHSEPQPQTQAVAPPSVLADLPPVALSVSPESGLVLVETSHRDTAPPEPEPEVQTGPRRTRKPRAPIVEEQLQIVETRKDQPPA